MYVQPVSAPAIWQVLPLSEFLFVVSACAYASPSTNYESFRGNKGATSPMLWAAFSPPHVAASKRLGSPGRLSCEKIFALVPGMKDQKRTARMRHVSAKL